MGEKTEKKPNEWRFRIESSKWALRRRTAHLYRSCDCKLACFRQ